MKKLILLLFLGISSFTIQAQKYLITNISWQQKIDKNHFLAPLFYGVNKSKAEIMNDSTLINSVTKKYGTPNLAYMQMIVNGWNYFAIGSIDSAIINFNTAFLLDTNNLETFYAQSNIIAFIDNAPNPELITAFNLDKRVSSGWDLMAFLGNDMFLQQLKSIQKNQTIVPYLETLLMHPKEPYMVDSGKYVLIKVRSDNHEGYYKLGRPNGLWTDYYSGSTKIMRTYHIVNGIENGQITAYYKNGKIAAIFYKNTTGDIDGEYKVFDYTGQLVRIEYWHNNRSDTKDSKIIKEWEEDGTIVHQNVNGRWKTYIWKDGKKTFKK